MPRSKQYVFSRPSVPLDFTGERYVSGIVGDIQHEHYHRYLFAAGLCAGKRVLDIACGEGYGSNLISQVAVSVIGIDIDPQTVAYAQATYGSETLRFLVGDATKIAIDDASVDIVVSFETIEHFRDHDGFLQELSRVLAPGGILVISSPNRPVYSEQSGHENPFHLRELDRAEFHAALSAQFPHVTLLEQRPVHGSVLIGEAAGGLAGFASEDGATYEHSPGVPDPVYFLAVASSAALPPLESSLLYNKAYEPSFKSSTEDAGRRALEKLATAHAAEMADLQLVHGADLDGLKLLHADEIEELTVALDKAKRLLTSERITASEARRLLKQSQYTEGEARQDRDHAEARASEAERRLAKLKTSWTWRMTAPLREIARFARRFSDPRAKVKLEAAWRHPTNAGKRKRFRTVRIDRVAATVGRPRTRLASNPKKTPNLLISARHPFSSTKRKDMRSRLGGRGIPHRSQNDISGAIDARLFRRYVENAAATPFEDDFVPLSTRHVSGAQCDVKLIAYYLPQFHPIAENDEWWGSGFTEWRNVTRGFPAFEGHYQPRRPGELGYYDLRLVDNLHRQVELAKQHGVSAFCFHFYWFGGTRLLELPIENFLNTPDLDLQFSLCWANENWSRRWDGGNHEVLMAQAHSAEDDVAFIRHLDKYFQDSRYLRVDGKPVLTVYRPEILPDVKATLARWRDEAVAMGHPGLYLIATNSFMFSDYQAYGFDALSEFPPHSMGPTQIQNELELGSMRRGGPVYSYSSVVDLEFAKPESTGTVHPGIMPSWDNSARKPFDGHIYHGSSPALFSHWLRKCFHRAQKHRPGERFVFINAWNEWAEGAYLEPDQRYGYAYLTACADAVKENSLALQSLPARSRPAGAGGRVHLALVSHDAMLYGAQLIALGIARTLVRDHGVELSIVLGGPGKLEPDFKALAPTEVVPGSFEDLDAWRVVAERLAASGVTAVLCNSLVSAKALGPLRSAGLRVVQLVHELPSLIKQYGLEGAAQQAATDADVIVFPSAYIRDRFIESAGPIRGQSVLRHQGLYLDLPSAGQRRSIRASARERLGIRPDQRVVLGAGSGDVRKGLDLWPALAAQVLQDCPDAVFVWAGAIEPNTRHWLEHDLRAAGLQGNVLLPGPTGDMAGMYAAADVYALTSREDPFPSVVIEAMASGLPTVVFENSGGIVDLVRDAGGAAVPYLDVEAMGRAIAGLLNDEDAAQKMGTALSEHISRDFDYAFYGADLLALAAPRQPSLSVVVPNYNYARHLRQRLQSIWAQNYPIDEIILLDDASSDGSDTVIDELAAESPVPVRVIRNAVNSGSVARQWALGVAEAQGELVWIAEADDYADPEFLSKVVAPFQTPEIVLSYCESRRVDEQSDVTALNYLSYVDDIDPLRWTADFRAGGQDEISEALCIKNPIPNVSAAVFRREALDLVLQKYLEEMASYRNVADWLCYLRLLENDGGVAFTAQPLNNHRRHTSSLTIASVDRRHFEEIAALQDLAADLVTVKPVKRRRALEYRKKIADQFGIAEA